MLLKEQQPLCEEVSRSWNLTGLQSADERNGGMAFSVYHLSTVFIGEIPLQEVTAAFPTQLIIFMFFLWVQHKF